jgi:hypothetical protein
VLYGHKPKHFGIQDTEVCQVQELDKWMQERELMSALIKQHLVRAQLTMKQQADKKCSEVSFAIGDQVFVKLQPYVQSSLAQRAHQKLAFKFFGPYTIAEKIGDVAYRLILPPSSSIHPVFHISQLKKLVRHSQNISQLPDEIAEYQVLKEILATRIRSKGNKEVEQVLMKWSHMPSELATWEDKISLQQHFSSATAWGQAVTQDPGDVNSPASPCNKIRARKANMRLGGPEWVL